MEPPPGDVRANQPAPTGSVQKNSKRAQPEGSPGWRQGLSDIQRGGKRGIAGGGKEGKSGKGPGLGRVGKPGIPLSISHFPSLPLVVGPHPKALSTTFSDIPPPPPHRQNLVV